MRLEVPWNGHLATLTPLSHAGLTPAPAVHSPQVLSRATDRKSTVIRGIHHVAISTPDLDRIVAFYRDVLGAEQVYEGGWGKGSQIIDRMVGLKGSSCRQAMLKLHNA